MGGPAHSFVCPAESEAILDEVACRLGAQSLSMEFGYAHGENGWSTNLPLGCLWHNDGKVYFNSHGQSDHSWGWDQGPLCQKLTAPKLILVNFTAPAHSFVCPAESEAILDEVACRLAAQSLNMEFGYVHGENSWSANLPLGCLWHMDGKAYFNPHGQSDHSWGWDQGPLCQKLAIPEPSTCKTSSGEACVFPFKSSNVTFHNEMFLGCATRGYEQPWCYTKVDQTGQGVPGHWGVCESSCRLAYQDIPYQGCKDDCMTWRFIPGADECMLSSDMGLYLDFNVSDDGTPVGCQGFENYHPKPLEVRRTDAQCPLNTLSVPAGAASLSQVVDLYADNQTQFVNDFAIALTKMLSNGYSDLTPAPAAGMTGFNCTYPGLNKAPDGTYKFYNCERQE